MMDPEFMRQTAQYHREDDLRREAEQDRLAAQAHAGEPGLPDRVVLGVGDALVTTGQQLREWYHLRRLHRLQREWLRQQSISHT